MEADLMVEHLRDNYPQAKVETIDDLGDLLVDRERLRSVLEEMDAVEQFDMEVDISDLAEDLMARIEQAASTNQLGELLDEVTDDFSGREQDALMAAARERRGTAYLAGNSGPKRPKKTRRLTCRTGG